jgi:hypothetical protein
MVPVGKKRKRGGASVPTQLLLPLFLSFRFSSLMKVETRGISYGSRNHVTKAEDPARS